MLNYKADTRIVLTLDAGGTNFVFSAMQGGSEIVKSVSKPSNANNLDKCLATLIDGFEVIKNQLHSEPVAISFAFPGPADYPNGIIGDLPNLTAFRGGIALGPFLEAHFNLPVFINNDGNLFAYGEALAGMLPTINSQLKNAGSTKQYQNLIGLTLGTGFGGGLVFNNHLLLGDNSNAAEVWLMSNRIKNTYNIEEIVSQRAIVNSYNYASDENDGMLTPHDVYNIAKAQTPGDKNAAINAFNEFGRGLGDAIANLITLFDGIVVIGGGISGAKEFFMPAVLAEIRAEFKSRSGEIKPRLVQVVFDYDDENSKHDFLKSHSKQIVIPGSNKTVAYDPIPRIAIAHSQLGASKAIQLGAYIFALNKLSI